MWSGLWSGPVVRACEAVGTPVFGAGSVTDLGVPAGAAGAPRTVGSLSSDLAGPPCPDKNDKGDKKDKGDKGDKGAAGKRGRHGPRRGSRHGPKGECP